VDQMEILVTDDKAKRDQLFEDYRKNGDDLERKVVKFSSVRPLLDEDGHQVAYVKHYEPTGHIGRGQLRFQYVSTWSIAWPRTAA
jgi:hypothetical protein